MSKKFNENMAVKLLSERLMYEMQGWDNAVSDGDMTKAEFNKNLSGENMFHFVEYLWSDSMEEGFLQSVQSSPLAIEAKHLNFLGNKKITEIKALAVAKAMVEF